MKRPEADNDKTQVRPPSQPVRKIPARFQASVVILKGHAAGMEYPISKAYAVIGRDREADVVLRDPMISRQHAVIVYRGGSFALKDLESTNGTHMNGTSIKQANLRHGDKFSVGNTLLQFILEDTGKNPTYEITE